MTWSMADSGAGSCRFRVPSGSAPSHRPAFRQAARAVRAGEPCELGAGASLRLSTEPRPPEFRPRFLPASRTEVPPGRQEAALRPPPSYSPTPVPSPQCSRRADAQDRVRVAVPGVAGVAGDGDALIATDGAPPFRLQPPRSTSILVTCLRMPFSATSDFSFLACRLFARLNRSASGLSFGALRFRHHGPMKAARIH
jgi:hypothetical protein